MKMIVLAAALLSAPVAVQAQASDPAAHRIAAYDDAVIAIAKAGGTVASRTQKFMPVVRDYYDVPGIAQLVVGPAWASATAAEKSSAIAALTRHSAVSLAKNFKSYDGTPFKIAPKVLDRGGRKVVQVSIGSDTLAYLMRRSAGSWRIVDVVAGGVSQLALQRADLATTVQAGGIPAMVRKLDQLDAVK